MLIGDSLALHRSDVNYCDTYFFKLKKELYLRNKRVDLIDKSNYGLTSHVLNDPLYLESINPEIVILHLGIVDCAPRRAFEKYYFIPGWGFKKLFGLILSKITNKLKVYGYRKENFVVTPLSQFEINFDCFLKRCLDLKVKHVIIVLINMPDYRMVKKNPKIIENIHRYNLALKTIAKSYDFITVVNPLCTGDEEFYVADGYHINANGHLRVFNYIQPVIMKFIET